MRSVWLFSLGLVVGCSKAHRPPKGVAAEQVGCKRGGVERSEPLETTWTGADGVLRVRYRVGVSCTKPKSGDAPPKDLWQECAWVGNDWNCGGWRAGVIEGGPQESEPSSVYMKPTERGRTGE